MTTRFFCLCFLLFSPLPICSQELWLGYGTSNAQWHWEGMSRSENARIALAFNNQPEWHWLSHYNLTLQTEIGTFHWQDTKWGDKHGLVIAPVINYQLPVNALPLTLRFGVGISYRNGEQWADRKLGSRWLFENRLELSAELYPQHHLGVAVFHYSNAGLASDNWGTNLLNLSYRYSW